MKKILMILTLGFISTRSLAGWPETDKAAHFGLSSVSVESLIKGCVSMTLTQELGCHLYSSTAIFAVGLAKEYHDQKVGKSFDTGDLSANILGIITGNVLQWQF